MSRLDSQASASHLRTSLFKVVFSSVTLAIVMSDITESYTMGGIVMVKHL